MLRSRRVWARRLASTQLVLWTTLGCGASAAVEIRTPSAPALVAIEARVCEELDRVVAPPPVSSDALRPRTVAVGTELSCALRGHDVVCWGELSGELSFGDDRRDVRVMQGLGPAVEVAADGAVCARREDGSVPCAFGSDFVEDTPALRGALRIAMGGRLLCGLFADGSVRCGRPGVDDPAPIVATGALDLHPTGRSVCITHADRDASCLSDDDFDGLRLDVPRGTAGAARLGPRGCDSAVVADAPRWCDWGDADLWGLREDGVVLHAGSYRDRWEPTRLDHVVELAAGEEHQCVRLEDGSVRCRGWNAAGEVDGTGSSPPGEPTRVLGVSDATDVVVADDFACALRFDGTVACWGRRSVRAEPRDLGVRLTELVTHDRDVCGRVQGSDQLYCFSEARDGAVVDGIAVARALVGGRVGLCAANAIGEVSCVDDERAFRVPALDRAHDLVIRTTVTDDDQTLQVCGLLPAGVRCVDMDRFTSRGPQPTREQWIRRGHVDRFFGSTEVWGGGLDLFLSDGRAEAMVIPGEARGDHHVWIEVGPTIRRDLSDWPAFEEAVVERSRWCIWSATGPLRCGGLDRELRAFESERQDPTQDEEAVEIPRLTDVRAVSLSQERTCAVDARGAVWCWGSAHGRGDGRPSFIDEPHVVDLAAAAPR